MAMHVFLAVPILALLLAPKHAGSSKAGGSVDTFTVYFLLATFSLFYHFTTTYGLLRASGWSLPSFLGSLYSGFFANHAQSSIASDMLGAMASSLLYFRKCETSKTTVFWTANMLLLGPAVVLPAWFLVERSREMKNATESNPKKAEVVSRQERRRAAADKKK
jgi:hypothetical protein